VRLGSAAGMGLPAVDRDSSTCSATSSQSLPPAGGLAGRACDPANKAQSLKAKKNQTNTTACVPGLRLVKTRPSQKSKNRPSQKSDNRPSQGSEIRPCRCGACEGVGRAASVPRPGAHSSRKQGTECKHHSLRPCRRLRLAKKIASDNF
jgi:hypothetical protein